jgi:hypothetical protein
MSRLLNALILSAALLLAAACSDDSTDAGGQLSTDDGAGTDSSSGSSDNPGTTTAPEDTTSTTIADDATTTESTADSTTGSTADNTGQVPFPDDELTGQPIDLFVEEGDVLAVVGVADDDELNMRAKPGTDQAVLAALAPTADDLTATGRARQLPSSIWFEVQADGLYGWVSSAFVAYLGGVDDATAEYLAAQGGTAPSAETMSELGLLVAEWFASDDPPSTIVQTVGPTVGDLGEVTYDVVGIGDDAVRGFRLHIFGAEEQPGDGFGLRSIERTTLCTRGLAGELCT